MSAGDQILVRLSSNSPEYLITSLTVANGSTSYSSESAEGVVACAKQAEIYRVIYPTQDGLCERIEKVTRQFDTSSPTHLLIYSLPPS